MGLADTVRDRQSHGHNFVIAAPSSGSGKTFVTLSILSALTARGEDVRSFKIGPDYIDPAYHQAATRAACFTLDGWAMTPRDLQVRFAAAQAKWNVVEGVMGLFDGPECGNGSTADVAAALNLPVVLVLDVKASSHSVAAILSGFMNYRAECTVVGVILNRVGSPRHERMVREAISPLNVPVIAALPTDKKLELPSRHLGLVQSVEHDDLNQFISDAGEFIAKHLDFDLLARVTQQELLAVDHSPQILAPLGQRVAVAIDEAFQFVYPHLIDGWRTAGAEITFFSPLANEAPRTDSDAIYLPGGYPELYAAELSQADQFAAGLRDHHDAGSLIYGECGGYMVMGRGLELGDGNTYKMAGILPVSTSFKTPKRHLGYRVVSHEQGLPWPADLAGHEFHYAAEVSRSDGVPYLFEAVDACGRPLGKMGARDGSACGSFAHIIDKGRVS
jgi:cobyrinic acid a,c-diamide synthase